MRLASLLGLLVLSGTAWSATLVGTEVPPYPDGLQEVGGVCVGDSIGLDHICDYAINTVEDAQGGQTLYAGKISRYDADGNPYWKVLDAMPYPSVTKEQILAMTTCRKDGNADTTIFAVAKASEEEWYKTIEKAYKLDLTQQKFIELDTSGIDCQNESWGL